VGSDDCPDRQRDPQPSNQAHAAQASLVVSPTSPTCEQPLSAEASYISRRSGGDAGHETVGWASVRECHPNGAVILRAWVDAARATRRGLTRKEPVFERHG
jgi:hypothetical protein